MDSSITGQASHIYNKQNSFIESAPNGSISRGSKSSVFYPAGHLSTSWPIKIQPRISYLGFNIWAILLIMVVFIPFSECQTCYKFQNRHCTVCSNNSHLYEGACYLNQLHCKTYKNGVQCIQCEIGYEIIESSKQCIQQKKNKRQLVQIEDQKIAVSPTNQAAPVQFIQKDGFFDTTARIAAVINSSFFVDQKSTQIKAPTSTLPSNKQIPYTKESNYVEIIDHTLFLQTNVNRVIRNFMQNQLSDIILSMDLIRIAVFRNGTTTYYYLAFRIYGQDRFHDFYIFSYDKTIKQVDFIRRVTVPQVNRVRLQLNDDDRWTKLSTFDQNMTHLISKYVMLHPLYNSQAKIIEVNVIKYSFIESANLRNSNPVPTILFDYSFKYYFPDVLKAPYEYVEFRYSKNVGLAKNSPQSIKDIGRIVFPKEEYQAVDPQNTVILESVDFNIQVNIMNPRNITDYILTELYQSLERAGAYRAMAYIQNKKRMFVQVDSSGNRDPLIFLFQNLPPGAPIPPALIDKNSNIGPFRAETNTDPPINPPISQNPVLGGNGAGLILQKSASSGPSPVPTPTPPTSTSTSTSTSSPPSSSASPPTAAVNKTNTTETPKQKPLTTSNTTISNSILGVLNPPGQKINNFSQFRIEPYDIPIINISAQNRNQLSPDYLCELTMNQIRLVIASHTNAMPEVISNITIIQRTCLLGILDRYIVDFVSKDPNLFDTSTTRRLIFQTARDLSRANISKGFNKSAVSAAKAFVESINIEHSTQTQTQGSDNTITQIRQPLSQSASGSLSTSSSLPPSQQPIQIKGMSVDKQSETKASVVVSTMINVGQPPRRSIFQSFSLIQSLISSLSTPTNSSVGGIAKIATTSNTTKGNTSATNGTQGNASKTGAVAPTTTSVINPTNKTNNNTSTPTSTSAATSTPTTTTTTTTTSTISITSLPAPSVLNPSTFILAPVPTSSTTPADTIPFKDLTSAIANNTKGPLPFPTQKANQAKILSSVDLSNSLIFNQSSVKSNTTIPTLSLSPSPSTPSSPSVSSTSPSANKTIGGTPNYAITGNMTDQQMRALSMSDNIFFPSYNPNKPDATPNPTLGNYSSTPFPSLTSSPNPTTLSSSGKDTIAITKIPLQLEIPSNSSANGIAFIPITYMHSNRYQNLQTIPLLENKSPQQTTIDFIKSKIQQIIKSPPNVTINVLCQRITKSTPVLLVVHIQLLSPATNSFYSRAKVYLTQKPLMILKIQYTDEGYFYIQPSLNSSSFQNNPQVLKIQQNVQSEFKRTLNRANISTNMIAEFPGNNTNAYNPVLTKFRRVANIYLIEFFFELEQYTGNVITLARIKPDKALEIYVVSQKIFKNQLNLLRTANKNFKELQIKKIKQIPQFAEVQKLFLSYQKQTNLKGSIEDLYYIEYKDSYQFSIRYVFPADSFDGRFSVEKKTKKVNILYFQSSSIQNQTKAQSITARNQSHSWGINVLYRCKVRNQLGKKCKVCQNGYFLSKDRNCYQLNNNCEIQSGMFCIKCLAGFNLNQDYNCE